MPIQVSGSDSGGREATVFSVAGGLVRCDQEGYGSKYTVSVFTRSGWQHLWTKDYYGGDPQYEIQTELENLIAESQPYDEPTAGAPPTPSEGPLQGLNYWDQLFGED